MTHKHNGAGKFRGFHSVCRNFLALQMMLLLAVSSHASVPKMVFAHYMVCNPVVGTRPTVEEFKNEIRAAQKRGIDGFVLNCGSWTQKYPYYKVWSMMIYEAARQMGTNFKLFFSVDRVYGDELEDMIKSTYDHPNQMRQDGKPVLSSYAQTFDPEFLQRLREIKKPVFLVPHYRSRNVHEVVDAADVEEIYRRGADTDGHFYFGAAGTGEGIAQSIRLFASRWNRGGKVFMAGISPYYRGITGTNYRVFETKGFQGMAAEWEAAIQANAQWVQIVTWNDWAEATYVAPFGTPDKTEIWGSKKFWGLELSHTAYLDASRYYIDWFKTGKKPTIQNDQAFYFYRLHPKTLQGRRDPVKEERIFPKGQPALIDNVFVTLFLKAPAQLTIFSGATQQTFSAPAGKSDFEMPFAPGKQRFVVKRGAATVIDKVGEHEISANDVTFNFNYFAGSAGEGIPKIHEVSLSPTADAFVRSGIHSKTNYGKSTAIGFQSQNGQAGTNENCIGYLKFDLTGATADIVAAMLRLEVSSGIWKADSGMPTIKLYSVPDASWKEQEINFENAPGLDRASFASTGTLIAELNVKIGSPRMSFDLTRFVKANLGKQVTLQLIGTSPTTDHFAVSSREMTAPGTQPLLLLTY